MIQIKDVAHYYIGQKCLNTWFMKGDLNYNPGWILTGINSSSVRPYKLETYTDSSWTDSIKPIFRRLFDMTVEEAIHLAKLVAVEAEFNNVTVSRNKFGDIVVSWDHDEYNASAEVVWSANQFHYLLKQGFDLWGLIESGQAIDQKALNQKA